MWQAFYSLQNNFLYLVSYLIIPNNLKTYIYRYALFLGEACLGHLCLSLLCIPLGTCIKDCYREPAPVSLKPLKSVYSLQHTNENV